jgi:hypothetical protein
VMTSDELSALLRMVTLGRFDTYLEELEVRTAELGEDEEDLRVEPVRSELGLPSVGNQTREIRSARTIPLLI